MGRQSRELPGWFQLTKKTASTLAAQELGTAKGIEQRGTMPKGFFGMKLGRLEVQIEPDMIFKSGRILLRLTLDGMASGRPRFYDRETLEEDDQLEYKYLQREREELLKEWVGSIGAGACHEAIDLLARRS